MERYERNQRGPEGKKGAEKEGADAPKTMRRSRSGRTYK
jgi:hypothetical protein